MKILKTIGREAYGAVKAVYAIVWFVTLFSVCILIGFGIGWLISQPILLIWGD